MKSRSRWLLCVCTVPFVMSAPSNLWGAGEFSLKVDVTGGNWGDPTIWIGDAVPTSDSTTDIVLQSGAGNPSILLQNNDGDPLDIVLRNLGYPSSTASTQLNTGNGGTLTIYGGIGNSGAAGQTIVAPIKLSADSHVITSYGSETITIQGIISNLSTAASVEKSGSGRLILSSPNTFSGTTLVSGGILQLNQRDALKFSTVNTGAYGSHFITFRTTGIQTFGALEGADDLVVNSAVVDGGSSGARTLNVGGNNSNTTYSGIISGEGTIVKAGTGRWEITGINTYTGGTTVSAGNLAVNGSTSTTGTVTVNNGATLSGIGTVGGATTILSGGIHSPGNSPGVETFSSGITYNASSIFEWELSTNIAKLSGGDETTPGSAGGAVRGTDYDGVDVDGGGVTIASGAIFKILLGESFVPTAPFWDSRQVWDVFLLDPLADPAITKSGVFNTFHVWNANGAGADTQYLDDYSSQGYFSYAYNTDGLGPYSGNLIWTAVPEPTSALAGLLLGTGLLRRSRQACGRKG